jgi:hypothetical protein
MEAVKGGVDNVTLEKLVMYSLQYLTDPDPDPELEARIESSVLGRLIAATVAAYQARLEISGAVS